MLRSLQDEMLPITANEIMDHDRQEDVETDWSRTSVVSSSLGPVMNSSQSPGSFHGLVAIGNLPSKQNRHRAPLHHRCSLFLLICLFALNCSAHLINLAGPSSIDEQMVENPEDVPASTAREKLLPLDDDLLGSALARLAKSGTILVDQRPPPVPQQQSAWDLEDVHDAINLRMRMRKREENGATSATSATLASTRVAKTIVVAATETSTALPTPFDSGFSNNVTQSCSSFLNGFLNNSTFKACLPFSLLLQSSNSFFQVEKSLVRTTQLLDYTCSANVTKCTAYTNELAANLSQSANCASDLSKQNPLVQQALTGLESYQVLFQASCLRNRDTASYCFADAVTNSSSPTDVYPYYLPLNVSLPGGSQPTCDGCLRDTMAVFQSATSNRSTPIASTYVTAAQLINVNCGPNYVNASLSADFVTTSAAPISHPINNLGLFALVFLAGSWLF